MNGLAANRIAAIVVIGAVAAWIGAGGFGFSASRPPPVRGGEESVRPLRRVGVPIAVVEPHRRRLVVSGRTEAVETVVITARGAGIIDELPVEKGTAVIAGTVVARRADEAGRADCGRRRPSSPSAGSNTRPPAG
jgi:multidrug efflux system membrane fusion protein